VKPDMKEVIEKGFQLFLNVKRKTDNQSLKTKHLVKC